MLVGFALAQIETSCIHKNYTVECINRMHFEEFSASKDLFYNDQEIVDNCYFNDIF